MKFVDEVEIEVRAGKGGAGARSFRREKFVPLGGPDGGNGGRGGSVILVVDPNCTTLLDFRYRAHWFAENGEPGAGSGKDGKAGNDLVIRVPQGTEVLDRETGTLLVDLSAAGQRHVIVQGGRGGKGNAFFRTATNQAPEHFQPGEAGEEKFIKLSLKLVADIGLVGFPNAGKSTLISRISAARPKIADYPFTTLTPNLGVVQATGGRSFVVADIPGLIPGAHLGKGLGIKFLKHIERTRVIAILIDPNQIDSSGAPVTPLDSYQQIVDELAAFSAELAEKPQLVIITKIETVPESDRDSLTALFENCGRRCLAISSVTGHNIPKLIELFAGTIAAGRREESES